RPITAIHYADDGNPATQSDPTWTPLFNSALPASIASVGPALLTPPYPDYVSGATTYASATMHAFASFFRTEEVGLPFYVTSSRSPGGRGSAPGSSEVTNGILEGGTGPGTPFRPADVEPAAPGGDVEGYGPPHLFAWH